MKKLIKRLLVGRDPVAEYPLVGLPDPQDVVTVVLVHRARRWDVTRNNVIVSLRPLRVAVALPLEDAAAFPSAARCRLIFETRGEGVFLGAVSLDYEERVDLGSHQLCFLGVRGHRNACASVPRQRAYEFVRWWAARKTGKPFNHQMSRAHLRAFYVLYSSPRPVALVSFERDGEGNMFPMDLLGPTDAGRFLLSLHKPSPAFALVKAAGAVVVSKMPNDASAAVYAIGANHRLARANWETLPIELRRTPTLGVRAPATALKVVEAEIETILDPGSHSLLVTRPIAEHEWAPGDVMHHTQGFCSRLVRESASRALAPSS